MSTPATGPSNLGTLLLPVNFIGRMLRVGRERTLHCNHELHELQRGRYEHVMQRRGREIDKLKESQDDRCGEGKALPNKGFFRLGRLSTALSASLLPA